MSNENLWAGWVLKQGSIVKNWKHRWVTLSSHGVLRYYRIAKPDMSHGVDSSQLPKPAGEIDLRAEFKGIISGDKCEVHWPKGVNSMDSAFGVVAASRVFYFVLNSPEDGLDLKNSMTSFLEGNVGSPKSPELLGKRPPPPIPYEEYSQMSISKPKPGEVFYESVEIDRDIKKPEPKVPTYAVIKNDRKGKLPMPLPSNNNKDYEDLDQPQYANIPKNLSKADAAPGEVIYDALLGDKSPKQSEVVDQPMYAVSDKTRKKAKQPSPPPPPPKEKDRKLPLYENVELKGKRT
eukprot:m.72417 g.72417  ORF g.72417 m.72417 type:complete len:291 (+) comp12325_c0_seq1:227-1099(+)